MLLEEVYKKQKLKISAVNVSPYSPEKYKNPYDLEDYKQYGFTHFLDQVCFHVKREGWCDLLDKYWWCRYLKPLVL